MVTRDLARTDGPLDVSFELGRYVEAVRAALGDMADSEIVRRIWAHDHTVWKPVPEEITNRLGWLHAPREALELLPVVRKMVSVARDDGITRALLFGMGGSSLAGEMFSQVFRGETPGLEAVLTVLDSTDPAAVLTCAEQLVPTRTLFLVSTKSGTTVETLSFFRYFYNRTLDELDTEKAGHHFVAITDPGSPLLKTAAQYGFRDQFESDPNVGGRYSAFTYFGVVPAALLGGQIERLLGHALDASAACGADVEPERHPAAQLGCVLAELAKAGRDKATFVVSSRMASFGDWVEQLIAESTGKERTGIVPIVGELVGPPEVYGDDRLFIHIRLAGDDTYDRPMAILRAAGHPTVQIDLADPYELGALLFLWEFAVAVAGCRLGINPFNQPNVEAAKSHTRQFTREYTERGALPSGEVSPLHRDQLNAFLARASRGDYVAVQAFLEPTAETTAALEGLRTRVRDHTRLAVTTGYGPRYLHSTGQLHKGDAGNGLFIQFTADDLRDAMIPDEAGRPEAMLSFGVLKRAQALGDLHALRNSGRRVIHFHLQSDPIAGLDLLMGAS
jgi:glucose-6-phosphate isomerase